QEGGQIPLYKKLPTRGFSNARFRLEHFAVNLHTIENAYNDGDLVNVETLQAKRIVPRKISGGIKILSQGELTKKVTIEAQAFSQTAREKLEKNGIPYKIISIN